MWCDKYGSLLERMSFSEGSFFEGGKLPAATSDQDVFTMRQILHDWSDAEGISILKQVSVDIQIRNGEEEAGPVRDRFLCMYAGVSVCMLAG